MYINNKIKNTIQTITQEVIDNYSNYEQLNTNQSIEIFNYLDNNKHVNNLINYLSDKIKTKDSNIDTKVTLISMVGLPAVGKSYVINKKYSEYIKNKKFDVVKTGTNGIIIEPEGEYLEIYGKFQQVLKLLKSGSDINYRYYRGTFISKLIKVEYLRKILLNNNKIIICGDTYPKNASQLKDFNDLINLLKKTNIDVQSKIYFVTRIDSSLNFYNDKKHVAKMYSILSRLFEECYTSNSDLNNLIHLLNKYNIEKNLQIEIINIINSYIQRIERIKDDKDILLKKMYKRFSSYSRDIASLFHSNTDFEIVYNKTKSSKYVGL